MKLRKIETYVYEHGTLISFEDGSRKSFYQNGKMYSKSFQKPETSDVLQCSYFFKPIVKCFNILLDFSSQKEFAVGILHQFDNRYKILAFNDKNNMISENYIYKIKDTIYVFCYDYLKKTMFYYNSDGNAIDVPFNAISKTNPYRIVSDKKPAIVENIEEYTFKNIIILPKDDIERELYATGFYIIVKSNDLPKDNDSVTVTLKYYEIEKEKV